MAKEPERSVEATLVPLTAEDVRKHCRIIQTAEDSLIEDYIQSARTYFEDVYDLTILTTTWKAYWDRFVTPLVIPRPPYVSTTTLTYTDEAGATQTLTENTDFVVDSKSKYATIKPAESTSWPSDVEDDGYNAVTLTYVAGYTSAANIPATWLQALRLCVELMVERYGAYVERAVQEMPINNIDAMIGAYSVPQI